MFPWAAQGPELGEEVPAPPSPDCLDPPGVLELLDKMQSHINYSRPAARREGGDGRGGRRRGREWGDLAPGPEVGPSGSSSVQNLKS